MGWTLGPRKAEEGGLHAEERKDGTGLPDRDAGYEPGWRECAWN